MDRLSHSSFSLPTTRSQPPQTKLGISVRGPTKLKMVLKDITHPTAVATVLSYLKLSFICTNSYGLTLEHVVYVAVCNRPN